MTATTPGCGSTTDARKRLAEQNGTRLPHWDPAVVQLIEQARAEGAAEVVARVEALAKNGLRGFDMNPTLPVGGRDDSWWLGYLRRHENYWQSAVAEALRGPR